MARLGNVFNNKEDIKKEEQHPRRTIKWIHYTKLKENPGQYCPERDKEEIEALSHSLQHLMHQLLALYRLLLE